MVINSSRHKKILLIEDSIKNSPLRVENTAGEQNSCLNAGAFCLFRSGDGLNHSSPVVPYCKVYDIVPDEETSFYALSPGDQKLVLFKERLEKCKDPGWGFPVCDRCNIPVSKTRVRFSCLNPYCNHPECIEGRLKIVKNHLKSYPIVTNRFYHFSINFVPVPEIYDQLRSVMDSTAREFINKLRKLVPQAYFIMVRDINKSKEGLRIHYHVISFGWKGVRIPGNYIQIIYKSLSEGLRALLNTQLIGYRSKDKLFDYFSKRAVGVFGHVSKGTEFLYSDIITAQEYLDVFYGKRKIWFYLKNLRRVATELIKLLTEVPEKCPYCGYDHYHLIDVRVYKPPPDTFYRTGRDFTRANEYVPELELYKFCDSCDDFVSVRDWNFDHGMCRLCAKSHTSEGKMEIIQREFRKYLEKEEDLIHADGKIYGSEH